jgi:transcriptional regulator with XRE-family HTH domain
MKGNIEPEQISAARELLGSWLADLRKAKGLSQTNLAALMGIDAATISKIEAGKWGITIDMLALFCLHLEYPLDNLFSVDIDQKD